MNRVIAELKTMSSLLSGKQKEIYQEMIADAEDVKIVPIRKVFSDEEINLVKRIVKPQRHECYKNAFQLTTLFPNKVEYCEGKVTVGKILSIDHAWNKVGDKYVDITLELALEYDMNLLEEDYAMLGKWDSEELLSIALDMKVYGGVYEYCKKKKGI